jgi:hypothetical protein
MSSVTVIATIADPGEHCTIRIPRLAEARSPANI